MPQGQPEPQARGVYAVKVVECPCGREGGIVILLGLGDKPHNQTFIGTGMHDSVIYIRGKVDKLQVAGQVDISEPGVEDRKLLDKFVGEFVESFPDLGLNKEEVLKGEFIKLAQKSKRPYATVYAQGVICSLMFLFI